jgi:cytochrome c peroxidase
MTQLDLKHISTVFLSAFFILFVSSCGSSNQIESNSPAPVSMVKKAPFRYEKYKTFFTPIEGYATSKDYTITEERILLGKHLYFDNRLSKDGKNSCNSCHNLKSFGVDNLALSVGDLGKNGTRNSPSTFNSALHFLQFWDGRAVDVEEQAGGPILNPAEMNIPSKRFLVDRLSKIKGYPELFKKAFPKADTSLTYWNIQQAIGSFERTLITPSKFDKLLKGDNEALNEKELKGLASFSDNGCITCHNGALLGGTSFQKFGVHSNYWEATKSTTIDNGRFDVTHNEFDKYSFKVPSLRNVEKTSPYFHDGSVNDLHQAVKIMAKIQLNKDLGDEEINNIVAFLNTLTADISDEQKKAPATL